MNKPIELKVLSKYKLWLRYDDGVQGEVDLSNLLDKGVFGRWRDSKFFELAHIADHGGIEWDRDIDLCPDALYLKITGKTPPEIFPNLSKHA